MSSDTPTSNDANPPAGWPTAKVVGLVAAVAVAVAAVAFTFGSNDPAPAQDSVDVGFLQDMISHHEQAIELGLLGVALADDPNVTHFAQEAIVAQQWEIGYMAAILEEWGYGTGDIDRDSMVWMGMPTPVDEMPGMATREQLAEFRTMNPAAANIAFLELMTEHHRGGIHMAEDAAERADDSRVRDLAARMAKNQAAEIAEYDAVADSLGADPSTGDGHDHD